MQFTKSKTFSILHVCLTWLMLNCCLTFVSGQVFIIDGVEVVGISQLVRIIPSKDTIGKPQLYISAGTIVHNFGEHRSSEILKAIDNEKYIQKNIVHHKEKSNQSRKEIVKNDENKRLRKVELKNPLPLNSLKNSYNFLSVVTITPNYDLKFTSFFRESYCIREISIELKQEITLFKKVLLVKNDTPVHSVRPPPIS